MIANRENNSTERGHFREKKKKYSNFNFLLLAELNYEAKSQLSGFITIFLFEILFLVVIYQRNCQR